MLTVLNIGSHIDQYNVSVKLLAHFSMLKFENKCMLQQRVHTQGFYSTETRILKRLSKLSTKSTILISVLKEMGYDTAKMIMEEKQNRIQTYN